MRGALAAVADEVSVSLEATLCGVSGHGEQQLDRLSEMLGESISRMQVPGGEDNHSTAASEWMASLREHICQAVKESTAGAGGDQLEQLAALDAKLSALAGRVELCVSRTEDVKSVSSEIVQSSLVLKQSVDAMREDMAEMRSHMSAFGESLRENGEVCSVVDSMHHTLCQ